MGKKALQFATGLTAASAVLSFVCLFMAMHMMAIFSTGFQLATLTTYSLRYTFDWKNNNDACRFVKAFVRNNANDACNDVIGSKDLMGVQTRMCTTLSRAAWPALCPGFQFARTVGLSLVLVVVMQVSMQGIAVWLNYQYQVHSPKKKYRDTALILLVIGVLLTSVNLVFYHVFVIASLDQLAHPSPLMPHTMLLGFSAGVPREGYIVQWVSVFLQIISIMLYRSGRIKEEGYLKQAKLDQEFEMSLAPAWNGTPGCHGPDAYGPEFGIQAPQAYHSGEVYAQQGYGMQQTGQGHEGGRYAAPDYAMQQQQQQMMQQQQQQMMQQQQQQQQMQQQMQQQPYGPGPGFPNDPQMMPPGGHGSMRFSG